MTRRRLRGALARRKEIGAARGPGQAGSPSGAARKICAHPVVLALKWLRLAMASACAAIGAKGAA